MIRRPPGSTRTDTLFPCTTLFRSGGLDDASSLAFAPNTHDFLRRLLSCLPVGRPPRILTSDGEFHSFTRQAARLEEEGPAAVTRVPVEPFEGFAARFDAAAEARAFVLVYLRSEASRVRHACVLTFTSLWLPSHIKKK